MSRFKSKQISLLVATDVAARGIDVNDLTHVINYNLPDQNEVYTHRSGRTGRANKSGVSISIFTPSELRKVKSLERMIGKDFVVKKVPGKKEIFAKQVEGFVETITEENNLDTSSIENFTEIEEKLKKLKKEELIKLFLVDKFSYLIDSYKNAREINVDAKPRKEFKEDANSTTLKINFGKKQGFDVKSLFSLFNSNKKLKTVQLGKISLMPTYTLFSVDKGQVANVMTLLKNAKYRGKTSAVTISKESPAFAYAGKKKYKSGGNYKNKKRNFRKRY